MLLRISSQTAEKSLYMALQSASSGEFDQLYISSVHDISSVLDIQSKKLGFVNRNVDFNIVLFMFESYIA